MVSILFIHLIVLYVVPVLWVPVVIYYEFSFYFLLILNWSNNQWSYKNIINFDKTKWKLIGYMIFFTKTQIKENNIQNNYVSSILSQGIIPIQNIGMIIGGI